LVENLKTSSTKILGFFAGCTAKKWLPLEAVEAVFDLSAGAGSLKLTNEVFDVQGQGRRRAQVESLADLNLGDLCVLLCRSLLCSLVRDFAQKLTKIAE
jgi:hypothetical protein